jgi:hypothetical protein
MPGQLVAQRIGLEVGPSLVSHCPSPSAPFPTPVPPPPACLLLTQRPVVFSMLVSILLHLQVNTARPPTPYVGDPAVAARLSDDGGGGADGPSVTQPRLTVEAFERVMVNSGLSDAGTHLHQQSQACTIIDRCWFSVPHVITTH